uniref:Methyltransferase n=1 Tax=viral metagenome TaxID=1070528 RepID=A0A2V0RBF3_9ZZZZ
MRKKKKSQQHAVAAAIAAINNAEHGNSSNAMECEDPPQAGLQLEPSTHMDVSDEGDSLMSDSTTDSVGSDYVSSDEEGARPKTHYINVSGPPHKGIQSGNRQVSTGTPSTSSARTIGSTVGKGPISRDTRSRDCQNARPTVRRNNWREHRNSTPFQRACSRAAGYDLTPHGPPGASRVSPATPNKKQRSKAATEDADEMHVNTMKALEKIVQMGGKNVLVVGCGQHERQKSYLRMGAEKVTFLDSNPKVVEHLPKKFHGMDFGTEYEVIKGDLFELESLAKTHAKFDVVVATKCLGHAIAQAAKDDSPTARHGNVNATFLLRMFMHGVSEVAKNAHHLIVDQLPYDGEEGPWTRGDDVSKDVWESMTSGGKYVDSHFKMSAFVELYYPSLSWSPSFGQKSVHAQKWHQVILERITKMPLAGHKYFRAPSALPLVGPFMVPGDVTAAREASMDVKVRNLYFALLRNAREMLTTDGRGTSHEKRPSLRGIAGHVGPGAVFVKHDGIQTVFTIRDGYVTVFCDPWTVFTKRIEGMPETIEIAGLMELLEAVPLDSRGEGDARNHGPYPRIGIITAITKYGNTSYTNGTDGVGYMHMEHRNALSVAGIICQVPALKMYIEGDWLRIAIGTFLHFTSTDGIVVVDEGKETFVKPSVRMSIDVTARDIAGGMQKAVAVMKLQGLDISEEARDIKARSARRTVRTASAVRVDVDLQACFGPQAETPSFQNVFEVGLSAGGVDIMRIRDDKSHPNSLATIAMTAARCRPGAMNMSGTSTQNLLGKVLDRVQEYTFKQRCGALLDVVDGQGVHIDIELDPSSLDVATQAP